MNVASSLWEKPEWLLPVAGLLSLFSHLLIAWVAIRWHRLSEQRFVRLLTGTQQRWSAVDRRLKEVAEESRHSWARLDRKVGRALLEADLELESSIRTPSVLEKRHHVTALARQGMDAGEISERLKMPRGEAELVLNLARCFSPLEKDRDRPMC